MCQRGLQLYSASTRPRTDMFCKQQLESLNVLTTYVCKRHHNGIMHEQPDSQNGIEQAAEKGRPTDEAKDWVPQTPSDPLWNMLRLTEFRIIVGGSILAALFSSSKCN